MAHLTKYKATQIAPMSRHWKRENKNYSNENIRQEFSYLNYNLAPERDYAWLNNYVKEHQSKANSRLNVLCDWVVTAPVELTEPKEQQRFFEETYQFLKKRYNHADNIYSAYVHMDETTPHLHFAFVPITEKGNISAKEVTNRLDLQTFHDDFQHYLDANLEYPCKVVNHDNISRSKSLDDYKKEQKMLKELNTIHVTEEQKSKFGNSYKITEEQKEKIDVIDELLPKLILLFEKVQEEIKEKQRSTEQTKKQAKSLRTAEGFIWLKSQEIDKRIERNVQMRTESLTEQLEKLNDLLDSTHNRNINLSTEISQGKKQVKKLKVEVLKQNKLIERYDEYLKEKGLFKEFLHYNTRMQKREIQREEEWER